MMRVASCALRKCDAFIVACYKSFKQQVQRESVLLESSFCKRLVSCFMTMSEAHQAQLICHPDVLRTMAATYILMEFHRM